MLQSHLPRVPFRGAAFVFAFLLLLLTMGRAVQSTMADAPLQVAYEEAEITPPLGGSMPGYFKDRQATGVLDSLKAKVLALRQGDERVALVACDLIGMGAPTVARIRAAVARQMAPAGMPAPQVWVHCTHSHTG